MEYIALARSWCVAYVSEYHHCCHQRTVVTQNSPFCIKEKKQTLAEPTSTPLSEYRTTCGGILEDSTNYLTWDIEAMEFNSALVPV